MKILHTSDWHLGRMLYGRKRHEAFEAFLAWMLDTLQRENIDVLLVAGDIFDTTTPGNRAQAMYYRFLSQVVSSPCRHVVIVAGNHDSPSFLNAPASLLKALDVHVVGQAQNPADEILVLRDVTSQPELIVCAVPYLRDRDIRQVEPGESPDDKERKLLEGIRQHYEVVAQHAVAVREQLGVPVPIVATGHLFTAGGQTIDGDGVRELYVGSLAHVTASIFPSCFDYVALGHLHVPQKVGGNELIRYSGSPLPMGFGEARQQKSVCLITFDGDFTQADAKMPANANASHASITSSQSVITARANGPSVQLLPVPVFQALERVRGDWSTIDNRLQELAKTGSPVWLEIIYEGTDLVGDLRDQLDRAVADTSLEILRVKNNRIVDRMASMAAPEETLDDLSVDEVFERCLDAHDIPDDQRPALQQAYHQVVKSVNGQLN
ncbi:exonuclease SbcCD subunit D C-terminal domain-containing protein [Neopusillimonas aromaticivorans]|uniref:exonuclease SbcCD subunit D C-terminal domain-containing protein n=1 Tax=Neopusillimonas aromaticivorans TaxID=2979868 RepID=UPI002591ED01|nr:exonuclease SbcCD subunit D C-terminal domain-containing protein [Neopusillimonas aromaticivorans]WJJ93966.1 exonuclease SbcCD subunit D C-terminal domain-containing protein [Neopusillimonas aromaticivorans]